MLIVLYWNHLQEKSFKVFDADPGLRANHFTDDPESFNNIIQGGGRGVTVIEQEKDAAVLVGWSSPSRVALVPQRTSQCKFLRVILITLPLSVTRISEFCLDFKYL